MLYPIYRALTGLSAPALQAMTRSRIGKGKEHPQRFTERFGMASHSRPMGRLIWIHGSSIGESLSVLPLLNTLQARLPDWHFLVTTSTLTSAELMAQRLPENVIHQFVPWDHPVWVGKFLDHWRPDAVVWLESELWPNMLHDFSKRKIPAGLINARMRPKSFKAWKRIKPLAQRMLGSFAFILVGARDYIDYFKELGGRNIRYIGSLKFGAKALPFDALKLSEMKTQIGGRQVIGFMQTHPTEERLAAETCTSLRQSVPGLLAIIVPRKNTRGVEVKVELEKLGHRVALRSAHEKITPKTDIYIADTIGEMGLWYSLCPVSVIGGSFIPHGGQNPIEGTHFAAAIFYGSYMFNFPELCAALEEGGAARMVPTRDALVPALEDIFANPAKLTEMRAASAALAEQNHAVIDSYAEEILALLVKRK
jgi:3-deoxy-D-manno-octulosonic-acid transferase